MFAPNMQFGCATKIEMKHSLQADEKMMERFREIADPSVTFSEGGDQTTTRY